MLNVSEGGARAGWRVAPALVLLLVPAWLAASQWPVLWAAHPAHLAALAVVAVGGTGLAWWLRKRLWLTALIAVVLVGPLVWLRPFGATSTAVPAGVAVEEHATVAYLRPSGVVRDGFVFYPGARVDPRAYFPLLGRLAAEGTLVAVVKPPVQFALLGTGAAGDVIEDNPGVPVWTVGGHSLGGVAASGFAEEDSRVRGLVLWASYPLGDLSAVDRLSVLSVSGSQDTFTTPADVAESRAKLPPDTVFVEVPGGIHGYFGDYGDQPGDGEPTTGRQEAQDRIVAATSDALARVRTP